MHAVSKVPPVRQLSESLQDLMPLPPPPRYRWRGAGDAACVAMHAFFPRGFTLIGGLVALLLFPCVCGRLRVYANCRRALSESSCRGSL